MKSERNIDHLIEATLDSASSIGEVKTPAFFKERVLREMAQQDKKLEEVAYLNWFTPKYQVAALFCFVFINLAAVLNSSDNYDENVNSFAEVYGLTETDSDSYIYQN